MPIVSSDTFNRANADTLGADAQGNSWISYGGNFGIRSNAARVIQLSGPTARAIVNGVNPADVDVSANVNGLVYGASQGVVARHRLVTATQPSMYAAVWILSPTFAEIRLLRVLAGQVTELSRVALPSPAQGRLRLRVQDDHLRVYWDNSLVIALDDPDVSEPGGVGLYSDQPFTTSFWDNWSADDITPAPPPPPAKLLYPTSKPQTIYLRFESDTPGTELKYTIDQPGTIDVTDVVAEPLAPNLWRGTYQVRAQNEPTYKDGLARVRVNIDGAQQQVLPFETSDYLVADCGGPYFRIDTVGPIVVPPAPLSVTRITERPFTIDFPFNEILDEGMGAVVGLEDGAGRVILVPDSITFPDPKRVRAAFVPPSPFQEPDGIYKLCVSEAFDCAGNMQLGPWCRAVRVDTSPPRVIQFSVEPRVISAVAGCNKTRITFSTDEPALDTMVVLVGGHLATRVFMSADKQLWVWEYTATGSETEGPADVVITLSDDNGHTGTETRTGAVVFDFTAPTITFVKPATDGEILSDQPLELEAKWFDTNGVALDSVQILLDGVDITGQCVLMEDRFTFQRY